MIYLMTLIFNFNFLWLLGIMLYTVVAVGHFMFLNSMGSGRMQLIDVLVCIFFPIMWIYVIIMILVTKL